jgi:hypothetical protein
MQRERCQVAGHIYRGFTEPIGGIEIVDGFGNDPLNPTETVSQELLYSIITEPRLDLPGPSSQSSDGTITSTLDFIWTSELGCSILWNRKTDIVSIGNRDFDRQKGNTFLIAIASGGGNETRQLKGLITHCSFQQPLERAREQLPNDSRIHSAELAK